MTAIPLTDLREAHLSKSERRELAAKRAWDARKRRYEDCLRQQGEVVKQETARWQAAKAAALVRGEDPRQVPRPDARPQIPCYRYLR